MKVYYLATECKPFSKVGGVGDVAGELPVELKKQGVDIEIITPLYGVISQTGLADTKQSFNVPFQGKKETVRIYQGEINGVRVHLFHNKTWFEGKHGDLDYGSVYVNSKTIPFYDDILRFSFFSEACLHFIEKNPPDIVHVNDWVLAYLLAKMRMKSLSPKRILTIHNVGYQGNIGKSNIAGWEIETILRDEQVGSSFEDPRVEWHSVNALRLGIESSHFVNTVSPNYCFEITRPEDQSRYFEGGKGLDFLASRLYGEGRLAGILNGYQYPFEPTDQQFKKTVSEKRAHKKALSGLFANPENMLLGFVGRAVEQKFKLLTERLDGKSVLEHLLEIPGINIAILATGLEEYESFMTRFSGRPNYQCIIAFDKEKAGQISLGSDLFLMPSLFEPCGITQMESLSHATPPLVRWTGGLVDTVRSHEKENGTGFGFDGQDRSDVLRNLVNTVRTALDLYQTNPEKYKALMHAGFKERFLWSDSARKYISDLYEQLMKKQ